MAIYYIDPTVGNLDNDGLSPSTALSTFKSDLGTIEEPAEIFIRRNTNLPHSNNSDVASFIAKRWPMPEDDGYADRPQDGIDAGWDDDEDINPVLAIEAGRSFYISSSVRRSGGLTFCQLDMECISTSTSDYPHLITTHDTDVTFKKLTIKGNASTLRLIKLHGLSASEGTEFLFEDVVINNLSYDTQEFGSNHSDLFSFNSQHHYYHKTMTFRRCDIRGIKSGFHFHLGGYYQTKTMINIEDSTFYAGSSGLTWSGSHDGYGRAARVEVNITDSQIVARPGTSIFVQGDSGDYGHSLYLTAENTTFVGTGNLIRNNTGHSYTPILRGLTLTNCVVDMGRIFYKANGGGRLYFEDDIKIYGGVLRNMQQAIYLGGGPLDTKGYKIYIINVEIDEVQTLIESYQEHKPLLGVISIRGAILTGSVAKGKIQGGVVTLEDCTISKPLTDGQCRGVSVYATGCSIDSINGSGCFLRAIGCRVDSSEWIVGTGASGEFIDSHLVSHNNGVTEAGGNATVTTSTVSTVTPSAGSATFVNSKVNGIVVSAKEEGESFIKEIVAQGRDANGESTEVSFKPSLSSMANGIINSVFYFYESGVNTITTYAIFNSEEAAESAQGFVQVISEGKLKTVPFTVEDDDGDWSDYPATFVKKKLVADVTGYSIPDGGRCRVTCSILGTKEGDRKFAVDHNIIGE